MFVEIKKIREDGTTIVRKFEFSAFTYIVNEALPNLLPKYKTLNIKMGKPVIVLTLFLANTFS